MEVVVQKLEENVGDLVLTVTAHHFDELGGEIMSGLEISNGISLPDPAECKAMRIVIARIVICIVVTQSPYCS